jgi:hypothetical protein
MKEDVWNEVAELVSRFVDPAVAAVDTEPIVALGAPKSTLPLIESEYDDKLAKPIEGGL